jgi:hypothetical protein
MSALSASQAVEINPGVVASRFRKVCGTGAFDPVKCNQVALEVEASFLGGLGKRPIQLCRALGFCSPSLGSSCVLAANVSATDVPTTAANADACTTNGKPYSAGGSLLQDRDSAPEVDYAPDNGGSGMAAGRVVGFSGPAGCVCHDLAQVLPPSLSCLGCQ